MTCGVPRGRCTTPRWSTTYNFDTIVGTQTRVLLLRGRRDDDTSRQRVDECALEFLRRKGWMTLDSGNLTRLPMDGVALPQSSG